MADNNGNDPNLKVEVGVVGDEGHNLRPPTDSLVSRTMRSVKSFTSYETILNGMEKGLLEMGKGIVGSPTQSDRVSGVPHEYDMDLYTALYKSDSLVFRGVNLTADHTTQSGFTIEGGTEENRQLIEDWSEYVGLNSLLHNTVKSLLIWGNAFFEVVKEPDEWYGALLKPIPPSSMYVYRTETGDVIGYIQVPKQRRFIRTARGYLPFRLKLPKVKTMSDLNTEAKRGWKGLVREAHPTAIPFDAEEIVHVKDNALPGGEYGLSVIEPMISSLTIYQGMRVDIGVISRRYAAPKTLWLVGDENMPATDEMMDQFKYYMDIQNIGDDVVVPSWIKFEVLGAGQMTMDLAPYLAMLRDDVFAGLSVPEILMGGTIKGTLASAQIQLESFSRRIVVLRQLLSNVCRMEIFPKVLGIKHPMTREEWQSVPKIKFNPILTEEQRYLRAMNLYNSNVLTREESRRLLEMPEEGDGHFAVEDQIRLADEQAKSASKYMAARSPSSGEDPSDPSNAGRRGPPQSTGGGGDDKKKAQKPDGEVPKDQGGGVGQA
ncbi:MAG: hypothetical protein DRP09_12125 [Candidatus Thorarchaeota archaeon]|nr:MAG: hypothetical protein DRP09_12125 [Candidatus Thorarchaeota archaeon]